MNNRPKDPKTARNKNVLVIGGSGSGKTRFFVKPNLMQCVSKDYPTSFVITDPKGSLIGEVGQLLIRSGYRVKVLNTINFSKSMKYNPFRYLHSEKDVLKLVNTLICNTKGEGEKSAEDFWVKSERLFYTALIGYIWQEAPEEEMNFTTLLEMINASEAREDDPEFQSPVDLMFERLEERDPDHFAVRQYKKFLLSAGKTRSSILISAGARMAPFDIREVRELMEDDELELDTIGDEKTALFLIMSDTDTTFNFILAMVQSQLINLLCDRADDKYGGRLPVHVRMILDEFANIGQIPNFDKLIATIRSREISASIILQSQSQLTAIVDVVAVSAGNSYGYKTSLWDIWANIIMYDLPGILLTGCIMLFISILFKNVIPAIPAMLLYFIYANIGTLSSAEDYHYQVKPGAIFIRFPQLFTETEIPSGIVSNQIFLLILAIVLLIASIQIWERRRDT